MKKKKFEKILESVKDIHITDYEDGNRDLIANFGSQVDREDIDRITEIYDVDYFVMTGDNMNLIVSFQIEKTDSGGSK